jgi:type I restriction enzyme S subunit
MKWKSCFIGDFVELGLADIQTGPFGTQLKASDYVSEGTPVINVRNIGYGDLRAVKLEYVGGQTTDKLSVHLLRDSDIVFGRKGAVDRHLFVTKEHENWMQGSDCIRLRIETDQISPRFVSYAFLSNEHQQWMLTQSGNKATMASLNQDIIKRIKLLLPPRLVQDKVVDILSAYDDLIENNRRRMALLEESARLLYREWFVRLRFPGHESTRIVNGVPEGWERKTLGDALILKRGYDLPANDRIDGPIPIVSSSGITGYHAEKKCDPPGIVTGRYGTLGQVYFIQEPFWPLNTALYVSDFKGIPPAYAALLLEFSLEGTQSDKAAIPGLNRNVAHRLPVLWSPRPLRDEFNEFALLSYEQSRILSLQNQKLRAARDLLLPKLMSGEIEV